MPRSAPRRCCAARSPPPASQALAHRPPRYQGATVFGVDGSYSAGVGGLGQRRRRARTRLPRHVSGRRVLPPGRQHPAAGRRRAAARRARRRPDPRHRHRATRSRSTWSRASACTSTRSTTSRTSARRWPPASARCCGLDTETIYQAIGQALHLTTATRQSRKGVISSWKAYAPAFAGKVAIEAVDRAMRGEGVARADLGGRGRRHRLAARRAPSTPTRCRCPSRASPSAPSWTATPRSTPPSTRRRRWIDLARRLRERIGDLDQIATIVLHTSHHTHYVIGTGADDPQKFDPDASRETLDHSLPYIFAVALQDGTWHHERSYAPERAHRPDTVELWHKITTAEDPEWTRRYHSPDPAEKAFGARVEITLKSGDGDRATRSPSPTPIRWAPGRSRASSTSASSPSWPTASSPPLSSTGSWLPSQRSADLTAGELGALNVAVDPPSARQGADHPDGDLLMTWPDRRGVQRRRQARSVPGRAGVWPAATVSGRVLAAGGQARRGAGFEGVYVSGAVLSADLGLPDIGLTTLTEVAARGAQIARGDRPAHADRRRHRIRRADERRAHRDDARGRRARGLSHRGPGQPEALRAPGRQGRRPGRRHGQAHARRRIRPPRPQLPHLARTDAAGSRASPPRSTAPAPTSTPAPT